MFDLTSDELSGSWEFGLSEALFWSATLRWLEVSGSAHHTDLGNLAAAEPPFLLL